MSGNAERWVADLPRKLQRTAPQMERETERLLVWAKRFAPRSVKNTLYRKGLSIFSTAPHAIESSTGGLITPKRARWLFVPLPGRRVTSRDGGLITVPRGSSLFKRYVIDKASKELVAIRVKAVKLRGSRWIDRAREAHINEAERRLAKDAERILSEVR